MKVAVLLGTLLALALGGMAIGGAISELSARQPVVPPAPTQTVVPGDFGMYTPPPTPEPVPTPTPAPTRPPVADETISIGTQVGQRAPILTLPHLPGGTIDTSAVEGPLWVNFMATWCPACRYELPMMRSVQMRNNIEIILVDVGEDADTVLDFMVDLGVDLPTALDEDGTAQAEWGAFALPVHFFIDDEGIVQEVVFGGAPPEIMNQAIRTILPDAVLDEE